MRARVILHEDGYTTFVQTNNDVKSLAIHLDGTLRLFFAEKERVYSSDEWNKLEIDK